MFGYRQVPSVSPANLGRKGHWHARPREEMAFRRIVGADLGLPVAAYSLIW
jgi:hypothetical protein